MTDFHAFPSTKGIPNDPSSYATLGAYNTLSCTPNQTATLITNVQLSQGVLFAFDINPGSQSGAILTMASSNRSGFYLIYYNSPTKSRIVYHVFNQAWSSPLTTSTPLTPGTNHLLI